MKLAFFAAFLLCASVVAAQDWPTKINGYKVYDPEISITNASLPFALNSNSTNLVLSDPTLVDLGLSGATVDVPFSAFSKTQSGRVDLVTFKDIFLDGFRVDVEDYKDTFSFIKGEWTVLTKPARITIKTSSLPRAIYNELVNSKKELSVTGTAFVFGKFKRMGFSFKRVVPVKIDLKVKNPLR